MPSSPSPLGGPEDHRHFPTVGSSRQGRVAMLPWTRTPRQPWVRQRRRWSQLELCLSKGCRVWPQTLPIRNDASAQETLCTTGCRPQICLMLVVCGYHVNLLPQGRIKLTLVPTVLIQTLLKSYSSCRLRNVYNGWNLKCLFLISESILIRF